jgi:hypothetical protein
MLKHPFSVLRFYNKSETVKQRDGIREPGYELVPASGASSSGRCNTSLKTFCAT